MKTVFIIFMVMLVLMVIGIIIETVCGAADEYAIASQLSEEEKMNKLINELKGIPYRCNDEDYEEYHVLADELLLKFIDNEDVTKAFEDIPKYYS